MHDRGYKDSCSGRGDYRGHQVRTNFVYKHHCDHCGEKSIYNHMPREPKCTDPTCTSNRHMNADGSRNYGEARELETNRMYLLIG